MGTKKINDTVFYIAVVVAVLNAIGFITENNWTAVVLFLLATFATYSLKPEKTLAIVTGIIVSNVYRALDGSHEGMENKKSELPDMGDDGLDDVPPPTEAVTPPKASTARKTSATTASTVSKKPKAKEESTLDDDLNLDNMLGGQGSLEGLMDRQTQLMKNLKNMQPMIAQAKNMLSALPKGFVKQALQQFKLKQK